MADINEYLDGLNMKFSEQEKQLLDIFAECWEYCHTHGCRGCEYRQGNEYMKMMLCTAYQYAKRLIAANVAPVRCGDTFYYVYFSGDKKIYEVDELVAEEVSDKRVWTDNGCCEIDIGDFGKFAFIDYQKARETAERLNNGK